MTRINSLIAASVAAVGLLVLVTSPVATAAEVTPAQITAARTAADHEAIAVAYEGEAAAADAKAASHEMMGKTYRTGGPPKGSAQVLVSHCERLTKQYRAAAGEYRALAAEHRKLATEAGR